MFSFLHSSAFVSGVIFSCSKQKKNYNFFLLGTNNKRRKIYFCPYYFYDFCQFDFLAKIMKYNVL